MEVKNLSGKEYSAVLSLFAAVSHYAELYPWLRKRAEMVPGTVELMDSVQENSQDIIDRILSTIPQEKLYHMKMDLGHVKLYIKVEPPGCVPSKDMTGYSYVPTKALNELLAYLVTHECIFCDKTATEARKCPYRGIIDKVLVHDVDGVDREHCKFSDITLEG